MIREAKKSVLRNVEDFLRKDIMEVVREMSVDRPLPRQMMRAAVAFLWNDLFSELPGSRSTAA